MMVSIIKKAVDKIDAMFAFRNIKANTQQFRDNLHIRVDEYKFSNEIKVLEAFENKQSLESIMALAIDISQPIRSKKFGKYGDYSKDTKKSLIEWAIIGSNQKMLEYLLERGKPDFARVDEDDVNMHYRLISDICHSRFRLSGDTSAMIKRLNSFATQEELCNALNYEGQKLSPMTLMLHTISNTYSRSGSGGLMPEALLELLTDAKSCIDTTGVLKRKGSIGCRTTPLFAFIYALSNTINPWPENLIQMMFGLIKHILSNMHSKESYISHSGHTPLHLAISLMSHKYRWSQVEIADVREFFKHEKALIELLMSYGYSLSDRDESGETPMDIAMKEKKSREEYAKRQAKHHREATKCVAPELDDELEDSEMVGLEEVIVVDDDEYGCDTEHAFGDLSEDDDKDKPYAIDLFVEMLLELEKEYANKQPES